MAANTTGAASGAASGAAMGTMISPGWGTAIGGIAGGLMGAFGGLGGGGSETTKVKLPDYIKEPSSRAGHGTEYLLQKQQKEGLLNPQQLAALGQLRSIAEQGSGLGGVPAQYLRELLGGTGLSQQSEGLARDIE